MSESGVHKRKRAQGELDPEVVAEVEREAGNQRSGRYRERLQSAAEALERGRYDDARRMVQPVLRDLPNIAMAHEIAGLAFYSTGQWRKAAAELELARQIDHSVRHHPVLADCYRAMKRYDVVTELWEDLKGASPAPALMAEGRIVTAGALADQGDLRGALSMMAKAREVPKKVRDHHLRQWYVLGDLLDRSGEIVEARRFFGMVAQADAEFADVMQRLAALGR
jgi:tetratricopeptide (TPR) repeat protein